MTNRLSGVGPVSDPSSLTKEELAALIDHTLLKPEATEENIAGVCEEARTYGFKSVCVNGSWISCVAKQLEGSGVIACSVVGFPLGATTSTAKAFEAEEAVASGALEIDMVLAVGRLKAGDRDYVNTDINAVRRAIGDKVLLKVIIETSKLTNEEKALACNIAVDAGADFVKTSTGFGGGGATPEDVALMRRTVGDGIGVKASGGVRDYAAAVAVIKAGASRIGASSGVAILAGASGTDAAGSGDY
jgi:deoxyribose-phosphate aldolase